MSQYQFDADLVAAALAEPGVADQVLGEILGEVVIPKVGQTYHDAVTVTAVQKKLNEKGFGPIKVDGIYGPETAGALKKMQAKYGLDQTGVVDYGALLALGVSAPPAVKVPAKSAASATSKPAVAPAPAAAAPAAASSFWSQPLWSGAPIRRWHGAAGGAAFAAVAIGLWKLVGRRR